MHHMKNINMGGLWTVLKCRRGNLSQGQMHHVRDFINTRLLVHKHVKISVDEWILETTHPQKHVKFLDQYTGQERLIRSHSSARFCFELSGNSN